MDLTSLTKISDALESGEITSVDLVSECIEQIKTKNGNINSFVYTNDEGAMKDAAEIDKLRKNGKAPSPFAGVPIAIKDNICTRGLPTSCASKILKNFIPPYDATVISRLKEKGFIIVGKNNMDEFAMGSSTETSAFGVCKNPWNTDFVPGGSSGGSAASVGAGMVSVSLGSDTGGSIRQPASCCGVVGLKPTYGLVSRYGLIAFASSLDQIGPMTRTVKDSGIILEIISGNDPKDSTSIPCSPVSYKDSFVEDGAKDLVLGIPEEYLNCELSPDVASAFQKVKSFYENAGFKTVPVSLPHMSYAVATYYILATAEASSNLARYDGVQYGLRAKESKNLLEMYSKTRSEGFGDEVKRRILLGTFVLSSGYYDAYYLKAQKVRTLISNDFRDAFKKCDLILSPTAPTPPFKIAERTEDPLEMYLSDIFTISANISGIPGISIPCGFTSEKLPLSFQLMGNYQEESKIFKAGHFYEINNDF